VVERERVGNNNKTGLSPDRGQRTRIVMYIIIIIILLSTTGVILFLTTYVAASAAAATSYCTNKIIFSSGRNGHGSRDRSAFFVSFCFSKFQIIWCLAITAPPGTLWRRAKCKQQIVNNKQSPCDSRGRRAHASTPSGSAHAHRRVPKGGGGGVRSYLRGARQVMCK